MKIVIFKEGILLPNLDGATTRLTSLATELIKFGVNIVFIHSDRGWSNPKQLANAPFRTILAKPNTYWDPNKLKHVLEKEQPDLIQCNDPEFIMKVGYPLKLIIGKPLVFEAHNADYMLLKRLKYPSNEVRLTKFKELCAAELADHITYVSEVDASLFEQVGIEKRKMSVIPNGVEIRPKSTTDKKNQLIFVGNMFYEPNKQAIELIAKHILPGIKDQGDMIIICVGVAPKALIKRFQNQRMKFTGPVSRKELIKLLDESQIGLCPLISGSGSRLKLLEYMASGLPIISTTIGAEGLILPREAAVIEDDITKHSKIAIDIITNKEKMAKMSMMSFRTVKKYDWEKSSKKFFRVYQKTICHEN